MTRVAFLSLLLLAACPGPEDSDPIETGDGGVAMDAGVSRDGGGPIETEGERLARIICEREVECCPGNTADCDLLAGLLAGLFSGNGIQLDRAAYDECVRRISQADCTLVADYGGRIPAVPFCGSMVRGTLENGATCGGLFGDEMCRSGRCGDDDTCQPLALEGEMCAPGHCAEGLACRLGNCRVPSDGGEICEDTGVCVEGYECFRAQGENDARCHAVTVIQPGETCGQGLVCSLGDDECYCPLGQEGCAQGLCGNASRCLP